MFKTIKTKLVYYDIISDLKFYCSVEGLRILRRKRNKRYREAFRYLWGFSFIFFAWCSITFLIKSITPEVA